MKAVITAAGYASRLWPLTRDTPKPLLSVQGKPILDHIVDKLAEIPEVDAVFVVANAKFFPAFDRWHSSRSFDVPVRLLNDGTSSNEDRLGQIGDVQFAIEQAGIDDDVVIAAGDNLFNFSLLDAYHVFRKKKAIVNPLYDIRSLSAARELGTVMLDENRVFAEFYEKHPRPKSTLVSLGIYFFPRSRLGIIKSYLSAGNNADKMGYFLEWLMKNEAVHGHIYLEKWFDIGWIEALEVARKEFRPAGRKMVVGEQHG